MKQHSARAQQTANSSRKTIVSWIINNVVVNMELMYEEILEHNQL